MLLTGKAKEDFLESFNKKCYDSFLEFEDLFSKNKELSIIRNALIIEWFDSVGIYIGIVRFNVGSGYFEARVHYNGGLYFTSISRIEATQKAIIKANEIYNNLNK